MNIICMIYVLFMDRLWIYNSEWIMNIMYRLCIKYEQIMNKSKIGMIPIIPCANPVNGRLLTIVSNP